MLQRVRANGNEWQRMVISTNSPLNLEKHPEVGLLILEQKQAPKNEIIAVRSRNWDSFLFVIYTTLKVCEDSMTQT